MIEYLKIVGFLDCLEDSKCKLGFKLNNFEAIIIIFIIFYLADRYIFHPKESITEGGNHPPGGVPEENGQLEQDMQIHPDLAALDQKSYPGLERLCDLSFDHQLCIALNNMDKSFSYSSQHEYYFDEIEEQEYQLFSQKKKQYFRSKKWKEIRNSILKRDNFACVLCKLSTEVTTIDVHHKSYKNIFNENMDDLVALCRQCHNDLHKASGYPSRDMGLLRLEYFWSEELSHVNKRGGRSRSRGKDLFLS